MDDDGDNKNRDIKQHVTTTEPISSGSPLAPGEINRQATTTQIPDVKPLVPKGEYSNLENVVTTIVQCLYIIILFL